MAFRDPLLCGSSSSKKTLLKRSSKKPIFIRHDRPSRPFNKCQKRHTKVLKKNYFWRDFLFSVKSLNIDQTKYKDTGEDTTAKLRNDYTMHWFLKGVTVCMIIYFHWNNHSIRLKNKHFMTRFVLFCLHCIMRTIICKFLAQKIFLKYILYKKGAKKTMVAQLTDRQISANFVQPWFFSSFFIKNGLYHILIWNGL